MFLHPVDTERHEGYSQYVKSPMDVSTMLDKVDAGAYRTTRHFVQDVELIVKNAKQYYHDQRDVRGKQIIHRAQEMLDHVEWHVTENIDLELRTRCDEFMQMRGSDPKDTSVLSDEAQPAAEYTRPLGPRTSSRVAGIKAPEVPLAAVPIEKLVKAAMPSEDPPASFPEATNAVLTKDSGTLEEGQEGLHPRTESGCEAEAAPDSEGSPEEGSMDAEPMPYETEDAPAAEFIPCREQLREQLEATLVSSTHDFTLEQLLALHHLLQSTLQGRQYERDRNVVVNELQQQVAQHVDELRWCPAEAAVVSPPVAQGSNQNLGTDPAHTTYPGRGT